jgi:Xaa-Pro aminopeptidase
MRRMPEVLIVGDTVRSPELRHEVPLGVPDPFFYAERDGQRFVMVGSLEMPRLRELGGYELAAPEELGSDDLIAQGMPRDQITLELAVRACRRFGITDALVPRTFPLEMADNLRANGIKLTPDRNFFDGRRRVKNQAEIEGIQRAQRAAEAGMAAARELLRRAEPNGGGLRVDGEQLTSELLKVAIDEAFIAHGCSADEFIVSHGPQSAIGHEMGSGQILPGEPIVIDLWPRDRESACFADMTRTFVVGEPPQELTEWQRLCREALDRALEHARPGVKGFELFKETCDLFQEHGFPTQLSKEPGTVLEDGFFHGLGHGVGLEVHEEPGLGISGDKELLAGDVITIEPGLYRQGYGGVRLEDLVLVTDDGAENLTDFAYDLAP